MDNPQISGTVQVWQAYLGTVSYWQTLVKGVTAKSTDCGPVYEVPGPIDRPGESFAISDMRGVKVAAPHYHANGETEIYFVLEGEGLVVIGGQEIHVSPGSVVVTPPNTAHFTLPQGLVMAVVNTPPFDVANNISVAETNAAVGFDLEQYLRLTS